MNKKLALFSITALLLTACGNNEDISQNGIESEDNNVSETEISEDENGDLDITEAEVAEVEDESSYVTLDEEKISGSFIFSSSDRRSNVTFDDGVIRFSDGNGNLRYRLANEGDRLVIGGEQPEVYLLKEKNDGYELVNIDDNGSKTGENLNLEKN